jgi:hypothetical protein
MLEGGAVIDMSVMMDYTEAEARAAFERVAQRYGWTSGPRSHGK